MKKSIMKTPCKEFFIKPDVNSWKLTFEFVGMKVWPLSPGLWCMLPLLPFIVCGLLVFSSIQQPFLLFKAYLKIEKKISWVKQAWNLNSVEYLNYFHFSKSLHKNKLSLIWKNMKSSSIWNLMAVLKWGRLPFT